MLRQLGGKKGDKYLGKACSPRHAGLTDPDTRLPWKQPLKCAIFLSPGAFFPPSCEAGAGHRHGAGLSPQPRGARTAPALKPGSARWSDNVAAEDCAELPAPQGRDEAGEVQRVLCLL